MKFWVKTILDRGPQEQLFVDANSIEELKDALEKLLNVAIEKTSVTDFQAQVVDKLGAGEDIITVRVRAMKPSMQETIMQSSQGSPAFLDTVSLENSRDIVFTRPSSRCGDRDSSTRSRPSLTREDDEMTASLNSSQSHVNVSRIGTVSVSESPCPSRRTSVKSSFTDAPLVDRVWISRDDLCALLNPLFNNKYNSDIIGCFVRVLEPQGYSIYQVVDVEPALRQLALDTVFSTEKRSIDTVSNAPPVKVEVNGWMKKMLNSFRTFPTAGFIEAKHSDLKSAISAATAALEETEPTADAQTPPPTPPKLSTSGGGRTPIHSVSPWQPPLFQKRNALGDSGSINNNNNNVPLFNPSRRGTSAHIPSAGLPSIRIVVKTNDLLKNTQVCISDSGKSPHDVHVVLFGTRQANSTSKKERSSDFAGCHLQLNALRPTGIERDRDITDKGYHLFGLPFQWNSGFSAVGQRHPLQSNFTTHTKEDGSLVQDFCLLHGESVDFLEACGSTSLPIPMWAQNEARDPIIVDVKMFPHHGALHAFYVICFNVKDVGSSRPSTAGNVAITPKTSSRKDGRASLRSSQTFPSEALVNVGSGDGSFNVSPGTAESLALPGMHSVTSSLDEGAWLSTLNSPAKLKFALAHAVSTDGQAWSIKSETEPMIQSFMRPPKFDAISAPFPCKNGEVTDGLCLGVYAPDNTTTLRLSTILSSNQPPSEATSPFYFLVNTSDESESAQWRRANYSLSLATDPEKLKDHLKTISLFVHKGSFFLGTVHRSVSTKLVVCTVPLQYAEEEDQ